MSALWTFATVAIAPLGAVVGGVVASTISVRASLLVGGVLMCAAAFVLPRERASG